MRKVLVVGLPRSGTTWSGQVLGRSTNTLYVHEPDGQHEPFACKARFGRAVQPVFQPGEKAEHYEQLWAAAFAGGRPASTVRDRLARRWYAAASVSDRNAAVNGKSPTPQLRAALALAQPLRPDPDATNRNVVAKSVLACRSVEWIADRFGPTVVVVRRHPLNVIASWREYGFGAHADTAAELATYAKTTWNVEPRVRGRFERQVMSYAVLAGALNTALARHDDWIVADHDALLDAPESGFRAVVAQAGLEFSPAAKEYLEASNEHGDGYVTRRSIDALRDRWLQVLTDDDLRVIGTIFDQFPESLGLPAGDSLHELEQSG